MQGSLSLQEHHQHPQCQEKHEHPDSGVGVVLHRELFGGQVGGCADRVLCAGPLAKGVIGQMWEFWILGGDLQKRGLRTATE